VCKNNCRSPFREFPGNRRRGADGFSFIELLIAISLMAVLVIGVLSMNSAYVKYNRSNKFYATGVQLAENGIETCMRMTYANLAGLSTSQGFGQIPGFPNFARTVAVSNFSDTTCTIRARVAWREGSSSNAVTSTWPIDISVVRTSL
jgi:prepilin-type N-terminal cleavage/methylation domain-containing protein